MKRILAILMVLAMTLSLCACGGGEKSPAQESTSSTNQETMEASDESTESVEGAEEVDDGGIEVDEGLLSVEVTLPASFFEEETPEEIKAAAEENGFKECIVNEDGSVTYKMSKAKHKEMLEEMKASMDESIDEMINGEDAVESFVKIEYKDEFSSFDVYVNPELYTEWDGLYVLAFYLSGAYYQAFDGKDVEKIDIVVNFINNDTNEIISTSSYREWMDNLDSEG